MVYLLVTHVTHIQKDVSQFVEKDISKKHGLSMFFSDLQVDPMAALYGDLPEASIIAAPKVWDVCQGPFWLFFLVDLWGSYEQNTEGQLLSCSLSWSLKEHEVDEVVE